MDEYTFTTADLARELRINVRTLRKHARQLGIGIDRGGSAGFLYSATDRQRLIEALKPPVPTDTRRRRRRAA